MITTEIEYFRFHIDLMHSAFKCFCSESLIKQLISRFYTTCCSYIHTYIDIRFINKYIHILVSSLIFVYIRRTLREQTKSFFSQTMMSRINTNKQAFALSCSPIKFGMSEFGIEIFDISFVFGPLGVAGFVCVRRFVKIICVRT